MSWIEALWLWIVGFVVWTLLTVVVLDWASRNGPHLVDAAPPGGVMTSTQPASSS